MVETCFGIAGRMLEIMPGTNTTQYRDPAVGLNKEFVVRDIEKGTCTIQHDVSAKPKVIQLPMFTHTTSTNFLFYCHSPEASSPVYKENYNCFLKHAWPEIRDDDTFFVCILHNVNDHFGFEWMSDNTIVIRRPNDGLDFGAFADGLHFTRLDDVKNCQESFHVFFMNDTIYGPTFPWWMPPVRWTDIFKNMLTQDVKLAGLTINPMHGSKPHVQSMLLVTDNVGLEIALKAKVFVRRSNKNDVVNNSEIAFSTAILQAGYNIDCIAELLHGKDYRISAEVPQGFSNVISPGGYGGYSIHPFETIFSKTNRMNRSLCNKIQTSKNELQQKTHQV